MRYTTLRLVFNSILEHFCNRFLPIESRRSNKGFKQDAVSECYSNYLFLDLRVCFSAFHTLVFVVKTMCLRVNWHLPVSHGYYGYLLCCCNDVKFHLKFFENFNSLSKSGRATQSSANN